MLWDKPNAPPKQIPETKAQIQTGPFAPDREGQLYNLA
jgi:hypothetical protein